MATKKDDPKAARYSWAENLLKLNRAKKHIADLEITKQISFEDDDQREEAVKGHYVALMGHIKGTKLVRPRKANAMFGGQPIYDEDEEDDV